jgi:8-oxo-dGTP pyrophosphatase MutT (NUDIX family)
MNRYVLPTLKSTEAMSDDDLCSLEYAVRSLRAIAERRELVGDTIQPIDDIRAASRRATAALTRLEPVAQRAALAVESSAAQSTPHRLVVAVATVVTYRGRVLLQQRIAKDGNGLWVLIGGKLDDGDSILDATLRELFEEAGLALSKDRFAQVSYGEGVTEQGMPFIILYNQVELLEHEIALVVNKEPAKCSGQAWFDPAALPADMWSRDRTVIEKALGCE